MGFFCDSFWNKTKGEFCMEEENNVYKKMSYGGSCILVSDKELKNYEEKKKFLEYLKTEGFSVWEIDKGSIHQCPLLFINICTKTWANLPKAGVGVAPVFGHQAISIDEFKVIYGIYKKHQEEWVREGRTSFWV